MITFLKQKLADSLNYIAGLYFCNAPDAWLECDEPLLITRFFNRIEDWGEVFDLRFHEQLRAALKDDAQVYELREG